MRQLTPLFPTLEQDGTPRMPCVRGCDFCARLARPADAFGVEQAVNKKHDVAQSLLQYAVQLCLPGRWTCGLLIAIDPVVVSDT